MGITNRFRERLLSCAPLVKRDSYESRDARTCFFCNDDLGLGPRSPVIQRSPKKSAHRYTLRMNFLKREFTIGSVCYKIRRAKKGNGHPYSRMIRSRLKHQSLQRCSAKKLKEVYSKKFLSPRNLSALRFHASNRSPTLDSLPGFYGDRLYRSLLEISQKKKKLLLLVPLLFLNPCLVSLFFPSLLFLF